MCVFIPGSFEKVLCLGTQPNTTPFALCSRTHCDCDWRDKIIIIMCTQRGREAVATAGGEEEHRNVSMAGYFVFRTRERFTWERELKDDTE